MNREVTVRVSLGPEEGAAAAQPPTPAPLEQLRAGPSAPPGMGAPTPAAGPAAAEAAVPPVPVPLEQLSALGPSAGPPVPQPLETLAAGAGVAGGPAPPSPSEEIRRAGVEPPPVPSPLEELGRAPDLGAPTAGEEPPSTSGARRKRSGR